MSLAHSDSLRTIDITHFGQLLPRPQIISANTAVNVSIDIVHIGHSNDSNEHSNHDSSRPTAVYIVDNVLSHYECKQIIATAQTFGLTSLQHSYAPSQRQAQRLCIIDQDLTRRLWQRLQPVQDLLEERTTKPFGFYQETSDDSKDAGWKMVGLNDCCRVSRYDAPSIGFIPHFDSPYVPMVNRRSVLSLILYLDDVGATDFYEAPTVSAQKDIVGLTTAEEIAVRGGLSAYKKTTIESKRGRVVMFPHDLLHAGAPVLSGTKWILRTDVVCESISTVQRGVVEEGGRERHCLAIEWFREAQNQELDGNVASASRFYERSLSLRRHAHDHTVQTRQYVPFLEFNMWSIILFFLDLNDLTFVSACSHTFQAWCMRNQDVRDIRFCKDHPEHSDLMVAVDLIRSREKRLQSYRLCKPHEQEKINKRLPDYLPRFIRRHGSRCKFLYSEEVFESNPDACLRALAMAAIYQFGVSTRSQTYVAQYDIQRNRALACTMQELLDAAYHELPLGGAWYHVHSTYNAELSRGAALEQSTATGNKLALRDALNISVDPRMLQAGQRIGFEANLKYKDEYKSAVIQAAEQQRTGYSEFNVRSTAVYRGKCRCGYQGGLKFEKLRSVDSTSHYNNLIYDFSRTRLSVVSSDQQSEEQCDCLPLKTTARRHWIVNLESIPISSFQHAAAQQCYCNSHKISDTEIFQRQFNTHHTLHHLHIYFVKKTKPRQSILSAEAKTDYIFFTQYNAVHSL